MSVLNSIVFWLKEKQGSSIDRGWWYCYCYCESVVGVVVVACGCCSGVAVIGILQVIATDLVSNHMSIHRGYEPNAAPVGAVTHVTMPVSFVDVLDRAMVEAEVAAQ